MRVATGYAALAALAAVGVLLFIHGARRLPRRHGAPRIRRAAGPARMRLAGAAGAGLVMAALTGWPVGVVVAAATVWWMPAVWGAGAQQKAVTERVQALAGWAEMLRDTLSAAAGLEQAILATAPLSPPAIRAQVTDMAGQIRAGARLPDALSALAVRLADPTADLVIISLRHAAVHHGTGLADRLGALATTAREHAVARERIGAERARTRSAVRIIIVLTVAMVAGMVVFNAGLLAPYATTTGQAVLAGVAGLFTAAFTWLHRLSSLRAAARVLDPTRPHRAGP